MAFPANVEVDDITGEVTKELDDPDLLQNRPALQRALVISGTYRGEKLSVRYRGIRRMREREGQTECERERERMRNKYDEREEEDRQSE